MPNNHLTPLQEALNNLQRATAIVIERGMNGDEAIERGEAMLYWAKQAERLLKPEVQRQGNDEPVGYMVWWGIVKMQLSWPPYKTREEAAMNAAPIKSNVVIRPLYDASALNGAAQAVPDGYIKFEGVDDTLEVMKAKELLRRKGYAVVQTHRSLYDYEPHPSQTDNKVRYAGKNDPIVGNKLIEHSLPPDPVEFGNLPGLAG